jgi:hypothetical protein
MIASLPFKNDSKHFNLEFQAFLWVPHKFSNLLKKAKGDQIIPQKREEGW